MFEIPTELYWLDLFFYNILKCPQHDYFLNKSCSTVTLRLFNSHPQHEVPLNYIKQRECRKLYKPIKGLL